MCTLTLSKRWLFQIYVCVTLGLPSCVLISGATQAEKIKLKKVGLFLEFFPWESLVWSPGGIFTRRYENGEGEGEVEELGRQYGGYRWPVKCVSKVGCGTLLMSVPEGHALTVAHVENPKYHYVHCRPLIIVSRIIHPSTARFRLLFP